MVDLKEYEDMKYIKSQLDHDLWKTHSHNKAATDGAVALEYEAG